MIIDIDKIIDKVEKLEDELTIIKGKYELMQEELTKLISLTSHEQEIRPRLEDLEHK